MNLNNVYYDPIKFGLDIVGEIDVGGSYEFDKFVVWSRRAWDGAGSRFVYGTDSGCSCPTPFEDVGVNDLIEIDTPDTLRRAIDVWAHDQYNKPDPTEVADLLAKVRGQ